MHIIYIASVFDDECLKKRFDGKPVLPYAANKYNTLLFEGIVKNHINITMLSIVPINRIIYEKIFFRGYTVEKTGQELCYLSQINLPVIKNIFNVLSSFFKTLFAPRDSAIICDVLVVSASIGAFFAAKIRGFKKLGIVTDLPKFQPIAKNPFMRKMNDKLISASDGYVLLTEQMNDAINTDKKPYIVLEGHANDDMKGRKHKPFDSGTKSVVYAGAIEKIYGIEMLCKAFLNIALPGETLHIYGKGEYSEEVCILAKENENIVYHGNRPNEEIVEAELNATLLVNPRPTDGEYTKYSFPSKTLEYMASGTPVLSSRLEGIPKEYENYIFFFNENTQASLGEKLREILDLSPDELAEKGEAAKTFALENKNNVVQSAKIIKFCQTLNEQGH